MDLLIPASYQGVLVNFLEMSRTLLLDLKVELRRIESNSFWVQRQAINPGSCNQDPENRFSVCTIETTDTVAKISALVPSDTGTEMALIKRPKDGEFVQGRVQLSGHALDSSGIKVVEFLRAGIVLASSSSAVFNFQWETAKEEPRILQSRRSRHQQSGNGRICNGARTSP